MKNINKSNAWDRPVSRKYYENLKQRINEIVTLVCGHENIVWVDEIIEYVDACLATPGDDFRIDSRHRNIECEVIFYALRNDIYRAVERSRRARARAMARRAAKESIVEIPTKTDDIDAKTDDIDNGNTHRENSVGQKHLKCLPKTVHAKRMPVRKPTPPDKPKPFPKISGKNGRIKFRRYIKKR